MLTKSIFIKYTVIILVILFCSCECTRSAKNKRKIGHISDVWHNKLSHTENITAKDHGRGFFLPSGLISLSKVLNFFPVGGERECQPSGYNVAKSGICLNAYDCRQRDGRSAGDCAQGLGVCCVFEVTCGGTVQNNLTYFMSPGFPELWSGEEDCNITVHKTHAGIMQLRIDFIHFTIGQPNRMTGECDEDAMVVGEGDSKFVICGQNHGQHVYYTLGSGSEKREAGELAGMSSTRVSLRAGAGSAEARLWLVRLAQVPLAHAAPHDCLQYHTDNNGTIKSFNYAINGRHLASQDYKACIRRNVGFCSVRYWPCDQRSFRIGPANGVPDVIDPAEVYAGPGGSGGAGTGFYGPDGAFVPNTVPATQAPLMDQPANETHNETQDQMADDTMQTQDDEMEGSGMDPQIQRVPTADQPSTLTRSGSGRSWSRWSPYSQHYKEQDRFRYFGYGNYGVGLAGHGRRRCQDRVTIPCENEYFVSSTMVGAGVCDPHHCGSTFCPGVQPQQCRIETSITPFAVSVHFGPPTLKRSPEENIGMCLRYSQLPCDT